MLDTSELPQFDTSIIKIYLQIFADFRSIPAEKLQEIIRLLKDRRDVSIEQVIRDVANANRCHHFKHERKRYLWGLYEKEEKIIKLC